MTQELIIENSTSTQTSFKESGLRRISARDLLDNQTALLIEHGDNEYILRLTRNDKLLLTK